MKEETSRKRKKWDKKGNCFDQRKKERVKMKQRKEEVEKGGCREGGKDLFFKREENIQRDDSEPATDK